MRRPASLADERLCNEVTPKFVDRRIAGTTSIGRVGIARCRGRVVVLVLQVGGRSEGSARGRQVRILEGMPE